MISSECLNNLSASDSFFCVIKQSPSIFIAKIRIKVRIKTQQLFLVIELQDNNQCLIYFNVVVRDEFFLTQHATTLPVCPS